MSGHLMTTWHTRRRRSLTMLTLLGWPAQSRTSNTASQFLERLHSRRFRLRLKTVMTRRLAVKTTRSLAYERARRLQLGRRRRRHSLEVSAPRLVVGQAPSLPDLLSLRRLFQSTRRSSQCIEKSPSPPSSPMRPLIRGADATSCGLQRSIMDSMPQPLIELASYVLAGFNLRAPRSRNQ